VRRRRWPGRDQGSFTAELAAGLPALMLLLLAGLTAVGAVMTKAQCVDAARAGAIAASRGEPGIPAAARIAPDGASVSVTPDGSSIAGAPGGGTVTVTVEAPIRLLGGALPRLTVRSVAVAAMEPTGSIP
jgi:Flp pilus assembly protein TadG